MIKENSDTNTFITTDSTNNSNDVKSLIDQYDKICSEYGDGSNFPTEDSG